ncbi:uncharacterized protein LOC143923400 [Lithobates pipiens]
MIDNTQSSDKAPENQEGVQNKNGNVTPGPPTEGKKTSQSVKSVSDTEAKKPQGTVEKKSKFSMKPFKPQSKPTEQKGEAKTKNRDASETLVSSRDTVTPREPDVKEHQPGKEKQERHRALLLSWEVSWNPLGIAAYLTEKIKVSHFTYVALSPPTKDSEWTPPVDQSSIVIIYSSPKSERPLYQMERYLDYCSSKKGTQKVIVLIGEEDDMKKWKDKWEENQFSNTLYQFRFSRAELDLITREDIVKEMLEKIEKLKKSLISPTGLQEKPSGHEEVKQVSQTTEKTKQGKQDKKKKQQPNKQDKDNMMKKKQTPPNNKTQLERHEDVKPAIRIVSWPKTDSHWLLTLLRSPYFRDTVKDVETVNVTGSELEKITEQASSVTTYILYFSKESLKLFCSQLPNSVKLLSIFENKNTIVVIDNLENKSTEKEATQLYNKLPISSLSKHLFLFWKREKETDYLTHLARSLTVAKEETAQKMKKFQNLIDEKIQGSDPPWPGPRIVGIFSRSAKEDYDWLEKLLKSPKCQDFVTDVRPFYISNKGYEDFYKEVPNCTFAILYHTKNRGRVNITDVTDSLYDMEIEYMSSALGRCNILVVIDDLKDSGSKEKQRILYTQPSIRKYARNLLLFTPEEKKDKEILLSKLMEIFVSPAIDEAETPKGAETSSGENEKGNSARKDTNNSAGKDANNSAGKDTDNSARKNTNNSAGKEANNSAGKDTDNSAGKNTNNSAGKDANNSAGKNTNNSARKEANNSAGKDANNSAGKDADNSAGKDANNSAGKDANNSAGKDTDSSAGKNTNNSAGKEANNSAGKDTDNSAGKNTNNSAGKEANNSAGRDTDNSAGKDANNSAGKDTDNSAREDTDKSAGKDANNSAGKNTNNSARKEANNSAGKDTDNSAGKDANNSAGKDANNSAGKDTDSSAGKNTNNSAGKEANNSAGKDADNSAGKDTDNSAGKDANNSAGKDANNSAGKDTNNSAGKDTDNSAGKDANNSAGKDTDKSAGKDANNSAGKDTDNSAGKDANNSAGKDTDKSAGKDANNSAGKDTDNSAGEKNTQNSGGEKDTNNSGGEKDTKNKVDGGNAAENLNKGDEGETNK